MRKHIQQLIILLFLGLSITISAQKGRVQLKDTLTIANDTVFQVDTLLIPNDSNSITISKAHYDSLLNDLKNINQKENQRNSQDVAKTDFTFFDKISFLFSDYQNIGIQSYITKKSTSLIISGGLNINKAFPLIGGIGIKQEIGLSEKLKLCPEIVALWYFPTNTTLPIQNNNHIGFGFTYLYNKKIEITISPSIYCSWRKNIDNNAMYNETIHMISNLKPFYAIETSANSTFDIGIGCSIIFTLKR